VDSSTLWLCHLRLLVAMDDCTLWLLAEANAEAVNAEAVNAEDCRLGAW
jgi:hypothetical protein